MTNTSSFWDLFFSVSANGLFQVEIENIKTGMFSEDCVFYTTVISSNDQQAHNLAINAVETGCGEDDMNMNIEESWFICIRINKNVLCPNYILHNKTLSPGDIL